MIVRPATSADLREIVRIHREAFPGFFLTRLGSSFLREYYRTVSAFEGGIALVGSSRGAGPEGFAVGFIEPSAFYRFLRSRRWRMACAALPGLLRRPVLLPQLLRNQNRATDAGRADRGLRESEFASLGVANSARGKGLGKALTEAFLDRSRAAGADRVTLTTDQLNNDSVNRFYVSLGFRVIGVEVHGARTLNRYEIHLAAARTTRRARAA